MTQLKTKAAFFWMLAEALKCQPVTTKACGTGTVFTETSQLSFCPWFSQKSLFSHACIHAVIRQVQDKLGG